MKKHIYSLLLSLSFALFVVQAFSSQDSASVSDGTDRGNGIVSVSDGVDKGNGIIFDGGDTGNGIISDGGDTGNGIA